MIRLLLLFVVVLIVELALLIQIGRWIGTLETVALVLLTGIAGFWLARLEGLRTLNRIRHDLQARHLPGDRLIDALLIFIAAVLLVTPGVITDAVGLLLLLPPTRAGIRRFIKNRLRRSRFIVIRGRRPEDDFIDVEAKPPSDEPDSDRQLPP